MSTCSFTIKYRVYFLNNENIPSNIHETKISTENAAEWTWPQFCDLTKLYNEDKNLLPDNTLTIVCEVFVYNKHAGINLTYQSNSKFLINNDLSQLLKSGVYSDVTFIFNDGEKIDAHKLILVARSPVFKSIFSHSIPGVKQEYLIHDVDSETFELMIKFIYTDKLDEMPRDDILLLTKAAAKYDLKNLSDTCGQYLSTTVTIHNVMEILTLAEKYNIENLKIYTKNFITANKQNVLNTLSPEYFESNLHHAPLFLF